MTMAATLPPRPIGEPHPSPSDLAYEREAERRLYNLREVLEAVGVPDNLIDRYADEIVDEWMEDMR